MREGVGLSATSRSFTSSQDIRGFLCNMMRIPVTKERHLLPRLWSHSGVYWGHWSVITSRSIVSDVCSRSGSLGNALLQFYWWSTRCSGKNTAGHFNSHQQEISIRIIRGPGGDGEMHFCSFSQCFVRYIFCIHAFGNLLFFILFWIIKLVFVMTERHLLNSVPVW